MTIDEQAENLRLEISKLTPVRDMTSTLGWKVVVEHFRAVMRLLEMQLTQETDYTKIVRLQERHKAFSEMLLSVDGMLTMCDNYRHVLSEIEEEVKTKEQYGI